KSRHSRKNRKPKNSNLKFVIPAQAGIQSVEVQSFPINHRNIKFPDSRFCGNDGGGDFCFSDKFLKLKISSFLRRQKTKNRNLKTAT
ncbi:TPA: hypothetical protein ACXH83_002117, partial [Neisseria meningitidis]